MAEIEFSWVIFVVMIALLMGVDLLMGSKRKFSVHPIKNALIWSSLWIALALLFNLWIWFHHGSTSALNFLTGYLVEKALSVDNLFVFLLFFNAFKIPLYLRHKVLFWGILGAFVMRILFITLGIAFVTYFHWAFYLLGAFLIVSGWKLMKNETQEVKSEQNVVILQIKKLIPIVDSTESRSFFVRQGGKLCATPLFLALVAIEMSDLVFAMDSIPAILGITTDPFIVITSNLFAILGLRSLYFALEGMLDLFHALHYGLAAILILIGVKMILADVVEVPVLISLTVVASLLGLSILYSLYYPKK